MEQRRSDAAVKDARIMSSKEECAVGMGQSSNNAALKDARTKSSKEECAVDMEQRSSASDAAVKDVQTLSSEEECALSMGQMAILLTNLLLLDQNSKRPLLFLIYLVQELPMR